MKKTIIAIMVMASGVVNAGSIKEKFMETNDKVDQKQNTEQELTRVLHENVNRALKMTLLEKYNMCDYEKVSVSNEAYEVSEMNKNLVYIQYGDFVGYYLFGTDPRKYLQAPESSNVILQPGTKIVRSYEKECKANESIMSLTYRAEK